MLPGLAAGAVAAVSPAGAEGADPAATAATAYARAREPIRVVIVHLLLSVNFQRCAVGSVERRGAASDLPASSVRDSADGGWNVFEPYRELRRSVPRPVGAQRRRREGHRPARAR